MYRSKDELSYVAKPASIFVATLVLVFLAISFLYTQITKIRGQISELNTTKEALQKKYDTLSSVETIVPVGMDIMEMILPPRTPVIYALNQIKNIALERQVTISDIKAGTTVQDSDGISKNSLSFSVEGGTQEIFSFLKIIERSLPLMKINNIDVISSNTSFSRMDVSLFTYSAKMPERIPALTAPISGLDQKDIEILTSLLQYRAPTIIQSEIDEFGSYGRVDPFN